MKWIRWVLLKIQSGHNTVHRRTDGQGDTSKPPFQLRWSGGYNYFHISQCINKQHQIPQGQPVSNLEILQDTISWKHIMEDHGMNAPKPRQMAPILKKNIKFILLNGNYCLLTKISLKFVPKAQVTNRPAMGSDNGLVLNRWWTIIRTNDGLVYIWVKSWNCGCLVTWFCYQLIAKPGNNTAAPLWPHPCAYSSHSASMN